MQQTLAIDIETYSSNDLSSCGVYKYTEADDFEILLFAYSFNGNPVHVIDLTVDELPSAVMQALTDERCLKTAFNASFERTCISKHFGIKLPASQWECTMVKASMLGLPLALFMVAKVLKLDEQKSAAGKALIKYFSCPCKPTKANGQRSRNKRITAEDKIDFFNENIGDTTAQRKFDEYADGIDEKWNEFIDYCRQDVVTELAIRNKIAFFEIPEAEKALYCLDQQINDEGVLLYPRLINNAIAMDVLNRKRLADRAVELTGLDNPNSAAQLKDWLSIELAEGVTSLKKDDIPALLAGTDCEIVTEVLGIRQEMSKTSIKKYDAMRKAICADDRLRGIFQFYGANRTGRWAGRIVQPQNLPKNFLSDLDLARETVIKGDLELLGMLYGNVPDTLSQLIRTAFVAPPGHTFLISDFSAIEARVIAWLAGERWRLDVFNTHGKIYEASAAQMFKIPLEDITKDLRSKGKVAELALGYQGGPNALVKMGALKMGLVEDELPKIVKMWRNANKQIVRLWQVVEDAALEAVIQNTSVQIMHGLRFFCERGILFIELPSKRRLAYFHPHIKDNKYGNTTLHYEGMDQTTKQWCTQETYGGKLVENIIQAIARDCLAEKMLAAANAPFKIVMHVHDEIVVEVFGFPDVSPHLNKIMSTPIAWAPGLPLAAESYETTYYKKD